MSKLSEGGLNLPERVRRAIEVFLRDLRLRYPDAEAYLYGSYARGIGSWTAT